jgi:hypothetical protein
MKNQLSDLITLVTDAVQESGIQTWAIGGGIAVRVHGYERETKDVDAFFLPEDRNRILRAFRGQGWHPEAVMAPFHYVVIPDGRSFARRIDVMFPEDDPDISAIETATEKSVVLEVMKDESVLAAELPVFTAEWLVLTKFYAHRHRDLGDIGELYQSGAFDPGEVLRLLQMMDPEKVPDLKAFFALLDRPASKGLSRPKRRPRT